MAKLKSRTSWAEKMNKPAQVQIIDMLEAKGKIWPAGRMLISTPKEVAAIVGNIAYGETMTLSELRNTLADRHHADYACPLTTSIFLRIVAEATEEARALGKSELVPYWRVVRDDRSLIDKLPEGVEGQATLLRKEGHTITQKGKKLLLG